MIAEAISLSISRRMISGVSGIGIATTSSDGFQRRRGFLKPVEQRNVERAFDVGKMVVNSRRRFDVDEL